MRYPGVTRSRINREQGISLVIVLLLLVAMSLLGIAILRSSAMQERMSANLRDRSITFQAAEAALRYAQEDILGAAMVDPDDAWDIRIPTVDDCVPNLSVCPSGMAPVWSSVPTEAFDFDGAGLSAPPEYWIEYLGLGPAVLGGCEDSGPAMELNCQNPIYRITARSRAEGRAEVVLQANIISRVPSS